MVPRPLVASTGVKARATRSVPKKLVSNARRSSSGVFA